MNPTETIVDNLNRTLLISWLENQLRQHNEAVEEIERWLIQTPELRINSHGEPVACYPALDKLYRAMNDMSRLKVALERREG